MYVVVLMGLGLSHNVGAKVWKTFIYNLSQNNVYKLWLRCTFAVGSPYY